MPFETQKFAKSSAKISIFFSIFQEDWQTKIFAKISLMKFWSNGQHIDLRCRRSAVRSRATSSFFFLFHQNFSFSPLFCFHYKFYIYVNARLPFKGYSKKIESSYSKFSMLLPNFQSPRLRRLVCLIYHIFRLLTKLKNIIERGI